MVPLQDRNDGTQEDLYYAYERQKAIRSYER